MRLRRLLPSERKTYQSLSLDEKLDLAQKIIGEAWRRFDWQKTAVAWTGGKDSTLLLWLIKKTAEERRHPLPRALFVDEGDVFPEIWEFVERMVKEWRLDFSVAHNRDVSAKAAGIGAPIKVADLNERNREEIKRLGFEEEEFAYEPESFVGNHLMKTVATNVWLEENGIEGLFVGVRWDEQEARAEDDFLREIEKPRHFRIEPLLPFTEADVWQAIRGRRIPYVRLYEQGYRSLGARVTTTKVTDKPAWEQDLEKTAERAGRRQDKEKIMKRLRDLGYM
jgi:phosphoadenosine phosphosulfate reductase